MIHRFLPSVFSTAASPMGAREGLSSLVAGAMTTLAGCNSFAECRPGMIPSGGGGLGVMDRAEVRSPSLVRSPILPVLCDEAVDKPLEAGVRGEIGDVSG
jgi:hypothetical protein